VRFPPGRLQFEVGVQTFNPETQALISRRQDNEQAEANLRWLRLHSQAHIHADLIIGLPGEDMESFGGGFDRLCALGPQEIQVGILKRLRGAPIARHSEAFAMRYNPLPPYEILANDRIDFETMRRLSRFARYWDLVANSGRFPQALPLLLGEAPFTRFLAFSDWLYAQTGLTSGLSLERLFQLLFEGMQGVLGLQAEAVRTALVADFARAGSLGTPRFLRRASAGEAASQSGRRQARHREGRS
jgi:hypothetical protein